ncbi:hypothetical protein MP638_000553 [Amoeboaphelidium occidentale]|nr:hypothetical protein MP638_000553 [Amoeboaphelidium occidentale]
MADINAPAGYYERRTVTRAALEGQVSNPQNDDGRFGGLTTNQLRKLLDVGKSVCTIARVSADGTQQQVGTGWHLGNGWIMSCQHVICELNEDSSDAHQLRFSFPDRSIGISPRVCIFAHFEDPPATHYLQEIGHDLALVQLFKDSKIIQQVFEGIPGLGGVDFREALVGEQLVSCHHGSALVAMEATGLHPQQFSISGARTVAFITNPHGIRLLIHSGHSYPLASGSPILIWEKSKWIVTAVSFAGQNGWIDVPSFGVSAQGGKKSWLQRTVFAASEIPVMYRNEYQLAGGTAAGVCQNLNSDLRENLMRVRIPRQPPPNVNREEFESIIWDEQQDT